MGAFKNAAGKPVLMRMVKGIQDNKAYLGEVDGLIGDGDHGMNMNKGFSVFEERFKDEDISFSEGLDELGMILLNEIGGSMGPIYGTIFMDMAEAGEDLDEITAADLGTMLEAGLNGLYGIVDAKVGDKTLVDTLAPSVDVMKAAGAEGKDFKEALAEIERMKTEILNLQGAAECPNCGARMPQGASFCSSCGAKMAEPEHFTGEVVDDEKFDE